MLHAAKLKWCEQMSKISVIIPVYNVEEYLSECIGSVLNQTYKDLQIICINDGSTDNSLKILNDYAVKDSRIVLVSQENQGVSTARNKGINVAEGEYITFLDPDDWFEPELIEFALKAINNSHSDIAIFCPNYLKNNKKEINKEQLEYLSEAKEKRYKHYRNNLVNYSWDKLYRTDFIKKNNIKFCEQIDQTEDVLFSLECLSHNPKIEYIPKCLYNYRINRAGSAMTNYSKLVVNQIKAFKTMLDCEFYINSNDQFKIFCINILLGGVIYFYILTARKTFSLKDFLELRKLVPYMKSKIPIELLMQNQEYLALSNLAEINLSNGKSCLKKVK